jgi:hypothetical protein
MLSASLLLYNINKFYFRHLQIDEPFLQMVIDVLPNFLIVPIFYFTLSVLQPYLFSRKNRHAVYYLSLLLFCVLLGLEEATGIFYMSKVSDIKDSLASYTAAAIIVSANELNKITRLKLGFPKTF